MFKLFTSCFSSRATNPQGTPINQQPSIRRQPSPDASDNSSNDEKKPASNLSLSAGTPIVQKVYSTEVQQAIKNMPEGWNEAFKKLPQETQQKFIKHQFSEEEELRLLAEIKERIKKNINNAKLSRVLNHAPEDSFHNLTHHPHDSFSCGTDMDTFANASALFNDSGKVDYVDEHGVPTDQQSDNISEDSSVANSEVSNDSIIISSPEEQSINSEYAQASEILETVRLSIDNYIAKLNQNDEDYQRWHEKLEEKHQFLKEKRKKFEEKRKDFVEKTSVPTDIDFPQTEDGLTSASPITTASQSIATQLKTALENTTMLRRIMEQLSPHERQQLANAANSDT